MLIINTPAEDGTLYTVRILTPDQIHWYRTRAHQRGPDAWRNATRLALDYVRRHALCSGPARVLSQVPLPLPPGGADCPEHQIHEGTSSASD